MIDENTKVVIQGMTGKEGQRGLKAMLEAGTNVVAGVTPGKGGQVLEDIPVFNTVKEALEHDAEISASVLYVPPMFLYKAAMEAMESGINLLLIFTENVPVKDTARLLEYAKAHSITIIGPTSIGFLNTRIGKLGSIIHSTDGKDFPKGDIAVISKSGGMTAETAKLLVANGFGLSICCGIGGDMLIGTTYADLLPLLEKDENTKALVVFGEFGGTYEEELAEAAKDFSKPIIAFISGQFAESITRNLYLGHAGAIIDQQHTAEQKKALLKRAGVIVANYHYEIPKLVKAALGR